MKKLLNWGGGELSLAPSDEWNATAVKTEEAHKLTLQIERQENQDVKFEWTGSITWTILQNRSSLETKIL